MKETGEATIKIELNSVNTQIPIRDQRMKELLFETKEYPTATIKAQLDLNWLKSIQEGEPKTTQMNAQLSLHGQEKSIKLSIMATKTQQGQVQVVSVKPTIINAKNWGLETGISKLKEVARLNSISLSVPVGFTLNFSEHP